MKIVTGHRNANHITSNDVQAFYKGVVGGDDYILDVGNHFDGEITRDTAGITTVTIKDGEGIMQGVHFRIEPGEVETVTLDVGTIDQIRYDLICARYTKDVSTGIESVALAVIKGENGGDVPTFVQGDIVGGDLTADAPLMVVKFDGLDPSFHNSKIPSILTSTAELYNEIRREDLLYTNPNTDVEIATRVVRADMTSYDYVDVVYTNTDTFDPSDATNKALLVARHPKGTKTQAVMMSVTNGGTGVKIAKRDVDVTDAIIRFNGASSLTFSGGEWTLNNAAVEALIPLYVYGGRW